MYSIHETWTCVSHGKSYPTHLGNPKGLLRVRSFHGNKSERLRVATSAGVW